MFASKDTLLTRPSGGYTIARSVRLRSSASAYFSRTVGTASNRKTFTYSAWIKRGDLTIANRILIQPNVSFEAIYFDNVTNALRVQSITGTTYDLRTTQLFRDPSAWYHIVVAFDTTQATSTNRIKIYVNGLQVTAFDISTYPTQNGDTAYNNAIAQYIGGTQYFDGYMTEINWIDGQALTPSSFGSTNATTGVWQPAKYTGTYGTNGFYLNFSDNSNNTAATIGKDYSGNGNNWTPNNISVTSGTTYDSMVDSPTVSAVSSNYCVMNPLVTPTSGSLSNGNLNSSQTYQGFPSSFAMSSGQWYWEITGLTNTASNNMRIGIAPQGYTVGIGTPGDLTGSYAYTANALKGSGGTYVSYGATYTDNDVIGVAFDATNGTLTFYKNGTSQGTAYTGISGTFFALTGSGSSATMTMCANFGQRPFSFSPPSGYVALNTFNLP